VALALFAVVAAAAAAAVVFAVALFARVALVEVRRRRIS
jgi:hypothetical protein